MSAGRSGAPHNGVALIRQFAILSLVIVALITVALCAVIWRARPAVGVAAFVPSALVLAPASSRKLLEMVRGATQRRRAQPAPQ